MPDFGSVLRLFCRVPTILPDGFTRGVHTILIEHAIQELPQAIKLESSQSSQSSQSVVSKS